MEISEIMFSIPPRFITTVVWPAAITCPECGNGLWWTKQTMGCSSCMYTISKYKYTNYWENSI